MAERAWSSSVLKGDGLQLKFDVDDWSLKMKRAWLTEFNSLKGGVGVLGDHIVKDAKKFAAKDTGRMRNAIRRTKVQSSGSKIWVEIGVTFEDLKNSASKAQTRVATLQARGSKASTTTMRRAKVPTRNYAFDQEYGTSKMQAHPFLRPAFAQAKNYAYSVLAKGANGNG